MSVFKKFVLVGVILLGFAVVAVVALWLYLQITLNASQNAVVPTSEGTAPDVTETAVDAVAEPAPAVITEPIPLNEVPLTPAQKSAAETVGIDVDTFEITPAMLNCAQEKLGATRIAEISAGDTPTFLETAKLLGCSGAQ